MNQNPKLAADLQVGDILADYWGTNVRWCDARVMEVHHVEGVGAFGKTHDAVRFRVVPVDPSVPDSPSVEPNGWSEHYADTTINTR